MSDSETQHSLSLPHNAVCLAHLYGDLQHVFVNAPPHRPLYKLHTPLTSSFFLSLEKILNETHEKWYR
jgi:hypothetical protein